MHRFLPKFNVLSKFTIFPKNASFFFLLPEYLFIFYQNADFSPKMHCFLPKCTVYYQNAPFFNQNKLFSTKVLNFLPKGTVIYQNAPFSPKQCFKIPVF